MIREEKQFLLKLGEKIDKLIDKEFEKEELDRAYFEFLIKVDILNDSFQKYEEMIILDTREKHYCMFCRKEAHYFLDEEFGYICAECYSKLKRKWDNGRL